MAQRSAVDPPSARLDARLVPAALTGWAVTAAGILWSLGAVLGWICLTVGLSGVLLWRLATGSARLRVVGVGMAAAGVVGAGFGFAIALRVDAVAHHPIAAAFGTTAEVAVTPVESPRSVGHGRLLFRAALRELERSETSGRAVVFAPARDFGAVMVGQPMRFRARIAAPARRDLTVAALTAVDAPTAGRAGPLHRVAYAVRAGFADAARRVLPADQAAMLPALVLGDMSAVTPITSQEFRAAGLTHLTAVSGANVTIVCGAVLFTSRIIGPRVAVALAGIALVLFVIVVQPSASVLRAAVMGAIALVAVLSSRRRQAIPALAATVLVLMVVTPELAVDVGLALSVVATAALVVLAPIWSRRLVAAGWPKPVADAVCVACAAQLVTAPLIAGISGRFSVISAAANLAVAALVAPITVLGSAAAAMCLLWPDGAQLLIRFTGPEVWCLLRVAHWSANVPGASVAVPSGFPGVLSVSAVGLSAVLLWRWRWFRAAVAVAACVLFAWSASGVMAGLSAGRDTIVGVSQQDSAVHLVLGDEALLVERAVADVLRSARQRAGTDDVPVDRVRAGDVGVYELAELLSPSLFADERVVVLESAGDAGKEAAELIAKAAEDVPAGTELVVLHSGGGRAKALANQLHKLGAQVHQCAKITKPGERTDFVRKEFRALKVKVGDDTLSALLDAVGSDIRELASACSQLVADTGGNVDVAAVRRYHHGKAEVKGFDIADKAVAGDVEGAVEALRWAMLRGEPHVVLADALAEAVHSIGRVGSLSGDPYRLASELGMPPWRVQKAQKQARRWSRDAVADAMRLVAALNADVKGAAADADYALEAAVKKVAELVAE